MEKYSVENASRNTNEIKQGDKLTVTFEGTYMAIPKMSGIYNPSAHTLVYGDTKSASKQCGGYDLPSKCAITLTLGDTVGEQIFEGGYISATMFCANDPMGAHRTLTDAGVGANFNAVQLTFNCGVYPTLTFNVAEKTECDHQWDDGEVTVAHTAAKAGEMRYTCEKCGEYKIVATTKGACSKFEVEVAAVAPTATKDGHEAGTWCSECHKVLSGMETIPATGYKTILDNTLDQLAKTVTEPTFGTNAGEWSVLTLARGEYYQTGNKYFEDYYARITETVKTTAASVDMNGALHKNKSTENSRLIMALSAIGKNPKNVGGVDVLGAYDANGLNWIKKQGINGPIFALIALDSNNYQTTDTTLRQQCVDFILEKELAGGGWALSGTAADPDITSMALQALVNYKSDKNVAAAANRAFAALSAMQQDNGGFASWGSVNSESIAQVIVACTAWGIDPDTDARFIKEGNSALKALLDFYIEDGRGFAHVLESGGGYTGGEVNGMATDQAGYALAAYDRFINGKTALYDMTDVKKEVSAEELCATITLPENIENKAGAKFNAIINLNGFLKDYRLIDSIVAIPEGVKVNGVTMGSRISGGEVSYFVEEETGKLRIVYFDADEGTVLTDSGDEYPVELMTINCELENALAVDELTLAITGMTFKQTSESETQVIVATDTATDTANLVEGVSFAVATLYTGDDIDLIPKEKTAIAVYVTGVAKGTKIEYNDGTNAVSLKYNQAISDKLGISSYLAIVASDMSLAGFAKEENYTITTENASSVSFGDINADAVINAQDALNIVNFWLRSIDAPTDDEILRANVTGDSRINTFDALGIVEYFVDGDEFAIVNLAATAGNGANA